MDFVITLKDFNGTQANNLTAIEKSVKNRFAEKESLEKAFSSWNYTYTVTSNNAEVVCYVQTTTSSSSVTSAYNMLSNLLEMLATIQFALLSYDNIPIVGALAFGTLTAAEQNAVNLVANNPDYPRIMIDDSAFVIIKNTVNEYTVAQASGDESYFIPSPDENTPRIKKDTDGKRFINYFNLIEFDMRQIAPQSISVLQSGTYMADFVLSHRNATSIFKNQWLQDYHTAMIKNVLQTEIIKSLYDM